MGHKIDQTLNTQKHQAELAERFQNSLTGLHATIESFANTLAPSKQLTGQLLKRTPTKPEDLRLEQPLGVNIALFLGKLATVVPTILWIACCWGGF